MKDHPYLKGSLEERTTILSKDTEALSEMLEESNSDNHTQDKHSAVSNFLKFIGYAIAQLPNKKQ